MYKAGEGQGLQREPYRTKRKGKTVETGVLTVNESKELTRS